MIDFASDLAQFRQETDISGIGQQSINQATPIMDPTQKASPEIEAQEISAPTFADDLNAFRQETAQVEPVGVASEVASRVNVLSGELIDKQREVEKKAQEERIRQLEETFDQAQDFESRSLASDFDEPGIQPTDRTRVETGQSGVLPGKFQVTQGFGNRNDGVEVFSGGVNYGVDFATPKNTPIAAPDGKWIVVDSNGSSKREGFIGNNDNRGYGNSVLIENAETGERIRFSHLNQASVKNGDIMFGGELVGKTGNTGNSTGAHLDVEYYDSNKQIRNILGSSYASGLFGR